MKLHSDFVYSTTCMFRDTHAQQFVHVVWLVWFGAVGLTAGACRAAGTL